MFKVVTPIAIVLVLTLASHSAQAGCDFYAAPDLLGDAQGGPTGVAGADGTSAEPFVMADFWDRGFALPGATLCLKDGIYRGADSMLDVTPNTSGALGNPITIRAVNDGGVFIDGEDLRRPFRLRWSNYWVLEGFNVANSSAFAVSIGGDISGTRIHHVTVRRVVAWDALITNGSSNNFHVWGIDYADDVLLEDVAGFGTGRKVFTVYRSRRVTMRRAFARWEGSGGGSAIPISCIYRSYDVICENNIAVWTAEQQPSIGVPSGGRGALAMDWLAYGDESWAADGDLNFDPKNAQMRMLGNIAIVPADLPDDPGSMPPTPLTPASATWMAYIKGVEYINNVAISNRNDMPLWRVEGCIDKPSAGAFCDWAIGLDETEAPLIARHNTGWGGNNLSKFTGWTVDDDRLEVAYGDPPPDVFQGTMGATVCHRYVDGELRDGTGVSAAEPLWPWPMNERILAATTAAVGHSPEDVTARIEGLLGPIPAACSAVAVPTGSGWGIAALALLLGAVAAITAPRARPALDIPAAE
ncbi:MAG: hypothetical protein GY894_00210 [Planctomycetes bacterium]|nr:hypothetical protein [Planctomycetota bacterium]